MKTKNAAVLFTSVPLLLASCGSTVSPRNDVQSEPLVVKDTSRELILAGNLNGQQIQGNVAGLTVQSGALEEQTTLQVTRLDSAAAPALPSVEGIYASYLLGEVAGSRVTGAWRVQADPTQFEKLATLNVNRDAGLSSQQLNDTITEVFLKDNLSGDIQLVATYYDDQPLVILDFADRVNEERGRIDFTYFSMTADFSAYKATCTAQGGEMIEGYCSFENKQVTPVGPLSAQAGTAMQVLSWNVGNVAINCLDYKNKICYHSTQRRATERLMAIESQGKPAVVMLQEMWNGDCQSVIGGGFANPFNWRLCERDRGVKSAERIFGNRYNWTCTEVAYDPRAGQRSNGWECVGVDPNRIEIANAYPATPTGLHPECLDYKKGFDTGYQPVILRDRYTGKTFYAVNTHLAGTPETQCRVKQIEDLGIFLRNKGLPDALIAGDFNTEPFNEAAGGGLAFRQQFGLEYTAQPAVATLISDGRTPSAYYGAGPFSVHTSALDHMLGRNFSGSCSVEGAFSGMDHRMLNCRVNHLF